MKISVRNKGHFHQVTMTRRCVIYICLSLVFIMALCPKQTQAGSVINIDPYVGDRKIPDITGGPGDSIILGSGEIIDVVIMGDGYLAAESTVFVNEARTWYTFHFGSGGSGGIRPYPFFARAFRVRAIWQPSDQRVDSLNRASYYRLFVDSALTGIIGGTWYNGGTEPDYGFNDSLFQAIDALDPKNDNKYPSDLDNSVNGQQVVKAMADVYRNLYVVMIICTDVKCGLSDGVSGMSKTVTNWRDNSQKVRVAFGATYVHEFGHAFAYLKDEYLLKRNTTAAWADPHPDSISVFNLANVAFSNERCDLLWKHLAPGGSHNNNVFSLIGNLFVGGQGGGDGWEYGVWHSEYKCLLNGTANNYFCSTSDVDFTNLRDRKNSCFWCEEITAIRILERTSEFIRISGGVPDGNYNEAGLAWYNLWDTLLRDDYYDYFDIDSLIRVKDSCFNQSCPACSLSCAAKKYSGLPECIAGCEIREVGNAIYVDHDLGADGNTGSKYSPKGTIAAAIAAACDPGRIVILKGDLVTYPTPVGLILTEPAILIPDGCDSVIIGE